MSLRDHFYETKILLEEVPVSEIASWLLEDGYFPERYVLPSSFCVKCFPLRDKPYYKELSKLPRKKLETISYPKTSLVSRQFGIMHPKHYHDIVFHIQENWTDILEHLFNEDHRIYSYSNPIPVSKRRQGCLSKLRAGRMIYEWITMAEKDLILDAGKYRYIAKTDIANFYSSLYTHTIPWALHGRKESLADKGCKLFGSKLDKLLQYANDARTNGITIGPALTDLIAEIVLARVDVEVSRALKNSITFTAARFKDDYRILCRNEEEGQKILQTLAGVLSEYNLVLNEKKTSISSLPDGLYRAHDRDYFPHSLKKKRTIDFKTFEHTLLIALDIHRRYSDTSILEKFISELFRRDKSLKVQFTQNTTRSFQEIKKMLELMFFLKRESPKLLCHVLAVCEQLYLAYREKFPNFKNHLAGRLKDEIKIASTQGSTFEVVWYIFFSRFIGLGITDFNQLIQDENIKQNGFYKTIQMSRQGIFKDSAVELFVKPNQLKGKSIAEQIAVFE